MTTNDPIRMKHEPTHTVFLHFDIGRDGVTRRFELHSLDSAREFAVSAARDGFWFDETTYMGAHRISSVQIWPLQGPPPPSPSPVQAGEPTPSVPNGGETRDNILRSADLPERLTRHLGAMNAYHVHGGNVGRLWRESEALIGECVQALKAAKVQALGLGGV